MLEKIIDGRTDLAFEFVAQGESASTKDKNKVSIIQWCAYYGDVSAIRFLLSHGESLQSLGDNMDLNGAAFHGYWQLCQFLLENGADVNKPLADTGETPLHSALCKANRPVYDYVVEVLLANGAKVNTKTYPSVNTGSFMRDSRTKEETPLHRAAAYGSEKVIKMLLDAGASREVKDVAGDTPLSWASSHLRPSTILRLLCYGEYSIHPANTSTYDHGAGWSQSDLHKGKPHF